MGVVGLLQKARDCCWDYHICQSGSDGQLHLPRCCQHRQVLADGLETLGDVCRFLKPEPSMMFN